MSAAVVRAAEAGVNRESYLLAPRALPDGSIEWTPTTDIVRRLREGDPTLGWEGDPTLTLTLDCVHQRWQVWRIIRDAAGERQVLVCSAPKRPGNVMPGNELLRRLAAHDTRHVDVFAKVERENAAADAERDRVAHDENEAVADKLGWALAKDLDFPAPDGRLYPLGGEGAP